MKTSYPTIPHHDLQKQAIRVKRAANNARLDWLSSISYHSSQRLIKALNL